MRNIYLTVCVVLFFVLNANAQLNYKFSAASGTYSDLVGGNTAVLTRDNYTADAHDDGFSNNLPIGFTFKYNSVDYTTISVNTNGFASFQAFDTLTDLNKYDYYTPDLANGPYSQKSMRPVLAPLWDDHDLFSPAGITYKTEGVAPNRVLTIQWDNVYWDLSSTDINMAFQLKLYETSNVVEFQYKQYAGAVGPRAAAAIGITAIGTGQGNFMSLNNTSASPVASFSTDTYTLNTKPATGQVYRFTPIEASSQLNYVNYHFTPMAGTYTSLSNGNVAQLIKDYSSTEAHDDGHTNPLPLGFTFRYNGVTYDSISASTNGFASFARLDTIVDENLYDYYTPDLTYGPYSDKNARPVLAPLWDDHDLFSANGITYKTEGNAPNRIFTIQWDNVYWDLSATQIGIAFQLKLYETSNVIQFQYKQYPGGIGTRAGASIGITGVGTGVGNFLSLNNTSSSPTASSTVDTYTLNTKPATGQVYQFTPITTFYSKSTGDLTDLATWGSNPDGSGNTPLNFTDYNQMFNLSNRVGIVNLTGSASRIDMGGQLNISSGITLETAGKLTIKSYPSYTGSIGPIPGGSSITGNVTVERFMSSLNNRAYRLLAPSVVTTTSIYNNWQEGGTAPASGLGITYGTHVTGSQTGANGFDQTLTGQASLFLYDQVSSTQKWDAVLDNTTSRTLDAKKGYLLFVRGDRNPAHLTSASSSSNSVIRATGSLLVGDVNYNSLESNGRFSLVTNPYASPINWNTLYTDPSTTNNSSNFENYYTYWDPNVGSRGAYVTVNLSGIKSIASDPTTGVPNATIEIQSGQAFFVKAKTGINAPTFTVKETHKSKTANIDVFRTVAPVQFGVSLFYNDAAMGRRIADGATALYHQDYTNGIDGDDAEKMSNFDENVAFVRENKMLSIESRSIIAANDTLFLNTSRLKTQQYEWQFAPGNFGNPALVASLRDKYLGTLTPINLTAVSVIPFSVTTDAASAAADRFSIVFGGLSALPLEMSTVKAYQKAAGIQVDWSTLTENNMDHYEVEKSLNGQQFAKAGTVASKGNSTSINTYGWFDASPVAGPNYYRIRSISKTGATEYSVIVKVVVAKGNQSITVYPNPIKGGMVNLQVNNLIKGKYTVTVVNNAGQQVYSKTINHAGGPVAYSLQLGRVAQGVYQLHVTGEGSAVSQQILVENK